MLNLHVKLGKKKSQIIHEELILNIERYHSSGTLFTDICENQEPENNISSYKIN